MVLAAGGGLVTMPRFDLELFLRLSSEYRTRRMYVVPPVMIALAKHPMVDAYDLSAVEQVNSGAAPLGGDVTETVAARLGCISTQGYGMTELSPVSHVSPFGKGRPGASGVAVPNTESRIIDPATLEDVPPGEDGELWVRGPQVMKGYYRQPEATRQVIDPDGWFHTGDIARIDEDGFVFIVDRIKDLIIRGGENIGCGHVEAALLMHPHVHEAAVYTVPDERLGEEVGATVYGADALDLEAVREFLREHLAHFEVPRYLRRSSVPLPRTPSGKILKRQLRDEAVASLEAGLPPD